MTEGGQALAVWFDEYAKGMSADELDDTLDTLRWMTAAAIRERAKRRRVEVLGGGRERKGAEQR